MSIVKKGEQYYAKIYYRDDLGVARTKWIKAGESRKEAERIEREIRVDLERSVIKISPKITLDQYFKKWLEEIVRPTLRPSTYENYKYALSHVAKTLGEIQVGKLTSINIRKYLSSTRDKSKPTTVHWRFGVLSSALDDAVREYKIIAHNPCDDMPPPKKNSPKNGAYSVEQVQTVLDLMQSTEIYLCVLLGALCGLRRGEISALRWSDIDLDNKKAYIRHHADRMPVEYAKQLPNGSEYTPVWQSIKKASAKTVLAIGPVKTSESENAIFLPDFLLRELKSQKTEQEWSRQRFGEAYKDLDFVCSWEDGTPFDPDYIYKQFQKVLKNHNKTLALRRKNNEENVPEDLPVLRIHDLRHTAATMMLLANVDIKIVSRTLRHKRSSFTRDVYQHVLEDMQERPAAVMDDLFKNQPHKQVVNK